MSTKYATTTANTSWLLRTAVAGVLLLAAGAFVLSYSALHAVAVAAGINPSLAGLYPLIIDGFITIASLAALHLNDHGPRVTWYPWSLLGGFFTVSVWCNALHAASRTGQVVLSGGTAALVSAMPPVALGLAIHLLILMLRPGRTSVYPADQYAAANRAETQAAGPTRQQTPRRARTKGSPPSRSPAAASSTRPRTEPAPVKSSTAAAGQENLLARAAAALQDAQRHDLELTGAELGRRLDVSARHGRRLLRSLGAHSEPSHTSETLPTT